MSAHIFPMTYGELFDTALKLARAGDADECERFITEYAAWLGQGGYEGAPRTPSDARAMALSNIGYLSGYGSSESMNLMLGAFHARHPVYGSVAPW